MLHFSLAVLARNAGSTLRRFPLAIISAAAGTCVLLIFSHRDFDVENNMQLMRLSMTFFLAMLLSISVAIYAERFTFGRGKNIAAWVFTLLAATVYYYSLPDSVNEITGIRFFLFSIGLHLLVAFSPFMVRGEMNGLWQFNKSIFIRILTSALYSGVLYTGLALALRAIDQLFEIHVKENYYFDLWVVLAGVFNTWFFLSGVPQNIPSLNDETSYPKGLKIFTVYVLLPLITIYLIILYLYAGKILITGNWPVGWVGYMVIAFAIFGILSFLLIYPLRDDESNMWVKSYSKLFYFLLIVPIILLFTAIYKRINQYGITEERYFVLLLAFWLSFITLYLIISGGKNIRIIPVSLCVTAFLSVVGPWSAFSVSHNSQFKELTNLLNSNHILVNGKADSAGTHDVKAIEYERIKNIIRYINNMHGHAKLQQYFNITLDSLFAEDKKSNFTSKGETALMLELLKMNKIESADEQAGKYFKLNEENILLKCRDYDFIKSISINSETEMIEFYSETDTVSLKYSSETGSITLSCRNLEPLVLETGEMLSSLSAAHEDAVPVERLTVESDNPQWKTKIIFSSVNCSRQEGKLQIDYASGMLMLKINFAGENEIGERGTR